MLHSFVHSLPYIQTLSYRYNGAIIGQGGPANSAFAGLWGAIASYYKNTPNIIFGIMNEPHDGVLFFYIQHDPFLRYCQTVPSITTWATTVQAAVTAIRNAGATSQICLLPGNNWTSVSNVG
jgi:endoglucanase